MVHTLAWILGFMVVVCLSSVVLLARFHMRAHELRIHAKSPTLATFPGIYAIIVGGVLIPLQELLQLEGIRYPCRLNLWQTWFFLPLWGAPFALRSLRVIIASRKGRRETFGVLLRRRTTLAMLAVICTVALVIVLILQETIDRYRPGSEATCYMFQEWKFLMFFCALQATIFGALARYLANVDDLLNISNELRVNFAGYFLLIAPYFGVLLHHYYRARGEDFPTAAQFLVAVMVLLSMANTMFVSIGGLDCCMLRRSKRHRRGGSDVTTSTVAASSAPASPTSPRAVRGGVRATASTMLQLQYGTVSAVLSNPDLAEAFGRLAERFLCVEAHEFLLVVRQYRSSETSREGPAVQHLIFLDIMREFVAANSEREVDISGDLRANMMKYMDYAEFSPLSERLRRGIFVAAEHEVEHVLALNVLPYFHNSFEFTEISAVTSQGGAPSTTLSEGPSQGQASAEDPESSSPGPGHPGRVWGTAAPLLTWPMDGTTGTSDAELVTLPRPGP